MLKFKLKNKKPKFTKLREHNLSQNHLSLEHMLDQISQLLKFKLEYAKQIPQIKHLIAFKIFKAHKHKLLSLWKLCLKLKLKVVTKVHREKQKNKKRQLHKQFFWNNKTRIYKLIKNKKQKLKFRRILLNFNLVKHKHRN